MNRKLGTYQAVDTLGKQPVELVIKVYDGMITGLQNARAAYLDSHNEEGQKQIDRVRKFIMHMYTTLDFAQGGEVAENLAKIYVYLLRGLDVVEATKEAAEIDRFIVIVQNIRAGFDGLRQQTGAVEMEHAVTTTGAFSASA